MPDDISLGPSFPPSLSGRAWILRAADPMEAARFAQAARVPEPIARLLLARGIAADAAEGYLAPRLRDLLPDPSSLADADAAAERIADAVVRGETIAVFGDYDVDGTASTALLVRLLRALGATVLHAVPDRVRDGYGPNVAAFRALAEAGARLIVCVDCGTAAHEPIASVAGLADVVVLDHHAVAGELPPARAVVNPNRPDDTSGLGHLCAAGVVFVAAVALMRRLRAIGRFDRTGAPELLDLLDLVALATVCDVVPMLGLNRAFVDRGLARISASPRPGLAALSSIAGLKRAIDTQALGFALGPRLNAAGRLADADLGVRLLLADDQPTAEALASRLDALNRERQGIERAVLADAIEEAERQVAADMPVLLVASDAWHEGVVGIVAGRLKERFHRPSFVFSVTAGIAKGSGRSVPAVHLGSAVQRAVAAGLARKGGGHALAAGVTAEAGALPALHAALCEAALGLAPPGPPPLELAGALSPEGADAALAEMIARLGPFGVGNEEPVFAASGGLAHVARMGRDGATLGLTLAGETGARLRAVMFRADDSPLAEALLSARGRSVRLAGRLRRDDFRGGDAVCLHVADAALA
ncbi:single-stranded-DNA-specific exonuclease RecJ [Elioraea rosea]|uniref:single-stranded-DNA-specific exonuclease RecJ n=1 Tax=Elioraea rosea TaxID=2492390 RepID=UPI001EF4507C|nr:single-stranded-DNA-specific exonuclease RecJ [Elioraea rosea]